MKINNKLINAKEFAYDGCHKIYLLEDDNDIKNAITSGYQVLPIEDLKKTYNSSCELRFIHNWKLTENYVAQFENAVFEED